MPLSAVESWTRDTVLTFACCSSDGNIPFPTRATTTRPRNTRHDDRSWIPAKEEPLYNRVLQGVAPLAPGKNFWEAPGKVLEASARPLAGTKACSLFFSILVLVPKFDRGGGPGGLGPPQNPKWLWKNHPTTAQQ